MDKELTGTFVY